MSAVRIVAGDRHVRSAEAALVDRAEDLLARAAAGPMRRIDRVLTGAADAEQRLRRAIEIETVPPRDAGETDPAERARTRAELHDVYLALRELRLQRRIESFEQAQEGLARLRNVGSTAELLERATREVCSSCGFERGVLSRIDGSEWILASAHFEEHSVWAEDFVRFGSRTRPTLSHPMLEAQMARRRAPALVTDATNHPHTHKPFVEHSRARGYVVAPIIPRGRVIGFLHADHHFSGRPVDELDRDTLWAFASGFAHVYERAVLLERLAEQRARVSRLMTRTSTIVDALCDSPVAADRPDCDRELLRGRTAALATVERGDRSTLTPREVEVLSLVATGATNAAIAGELFISEGTVKSHVRRILRKLSASNRAEAVSRYLRTQGERRSEPGLAR